MSSFQSHLQIRLALSQNIKRKVTIIHFIFINYAELTSIRMFLCQAKKVGIFRFWKNNWKCRVKFWIATIHWTYVIWNTRTCKMLDELIDWTKNICSLSPGKILPYGTAKILLASLNLTFRPNTIFPGPHYGWAFPICL